MREYRERGYLAQALLNQLFRLGHSSAAAWAAEPRRDGARRSTPAHLGRAPARVDEQQLLVWQKDAVHRLPLAAARAWLAPVLPSDAR